MSNKRPEEKIVHGAMKRMMMTSYISIPTTMGTPYIRKDDTIMDYLNDRENRIWVRNLKLSMRE